MVNIYIRMLAVSSRHVKIKFKIYLFEYWLRIAVNLLRVEWHEEDEFDMWEVYKTLPEHWKGDDLWKWFSIVHKKNNLQCFSEYTKLIGSTQTIINGELLASNFCIRIRLTRGEKPLVRNCTTNSNQWYLSASRFNLSGNISTQNIYVQSLNFERHH